MIKAIIFDFDGLIVDTETVWYEAYKEVLSQHEMELPLEEFSKVIGTHDTVFHSYIQRNLKTLVDINVIEKAAYQLFHVKMGEPTLRGGVEDYLKAAKHLHLKIGLASSSHREWVVGYLKKLNVFEYFEVLKTREDVSLVKPDPELYVRAIEALNISSDEAIAFEDSLNGLRAARSAGLRCAIVPNPVTSNLEFYDYAYKLNSMEDLPLTKLIELIDKKARKSL